MVLCDSTFSRLIEKLAIMSNDQRLRELEARIPTYPGPQYSYRLRLWKEHGSYESASIEERIKAAEQIVNERPSGLVWGYGVFLRLVDLLIERLSDPNSKIRNEAAAEL